MIEQLQGIKPLTNDQYDKCHENALARVAKRIGDRPTRQQFQRELGRLWTVLDLLAGIVFIAALVISSAHIIHHMGVATAAYEAGDTAGTNIGLGLWANIHQWGYIALAEGSMLLFMVLFAMTRNWRRWLFVVLAFTAMIFVILANWSSGTGILESVMPPIFTVGLGFHIERLIVQSIKRQNDVTRRYLDAMQVYEAAADDPTQHPEFIPMMRQEIWSKLVSLKANKDHADSPAALRHMAVKREMERETWAYDVDGQTYVPTLPEKPQETAHAGDMRPFGSTVPTVADLASGHGITATNGKI